MGHRINEKNMGRVTHDGEPKHGRKRSKALTKEELALAGEILQKVLDSLSHDESFNGHGPAHDEAVYTSGENFTLMLDNVQRRALWDIVDKLTD